MKPQRGAALEPQAQAHHVGGERLEPGHARDVPPDRQDLCPGLRHIADLDIAQGLRAAQQRLAGRALGGAQYGFLVRLQAHLAAQQIGLAHATAAIAALEGHRQTIAQTRI